MFKCTFCGKTLHWNSDFNLDEVYPWEEREGVVGMYGCYDCGLDYEIATFDDTDEVMINISNIYDDEE